MHASSKPSSKARPLLHGNVNEALTFNVALTNIKTRNVPTTTSSLKIQFGKHNEFLLSEFTAKEKNFSWDCTQEFDYGTTRQGLRDEFLRITLLERMGKEIGYVEINLYDIATGPVHQDFFVQMRKGFKESTRINLDIRMSQVIYATVKTLNLTCRLKENLKENLYNFCLKINTKDQEFTSEHSPSFHNVIFSSTVSEKLADEGKEENYQNVMEENKSLQNRSYFFTEITVSENKFQSSFPEQDQTMALTKEEIPISHPNTQSKSISLPSPKLISQNNRINATPSTLVRNTDISWDFHDNILSGVFLEANGSVRDLSIGSLQFLLWANKESQKTEDGPLYIDHKHIGECYIAIKRLFEDIEINFGENNQNDNVPSVSGEEASPQLHHQHLVKTRQFQEKLWFHGVHIGELEAKIIVEITPFYKQMICGVRTEEGVQKSSTVYLNKDKSSSFFNNVNIKEIKSLEQLKESLQTIVFNFSNTKTNQKTKIKLIDDLATTIQKVLEILKISHKESIISFRYKTPENLFAGQKILISIAKHLLEYADEVPISLRPVYYDGLLLIFHRGELQLNYMGFDDSSVEYLKNAQNASWKSSQIGDKLDIKRIQAKIEVCERYQSLLYLGLKKILEKINQRSVSEKERDFTEQFTAIAYFRVPEFRKKMLDIISDSIKDTSVEEWRGTEWKLGEKIDEKKKNQQFLSLFDWQNCFFVYLKNTEVGEKNFHILDDFLNETSWQSRMQKRGVAFYFFLSEWAKHVNYTIVVKEHLPWQDLPGYTILTKALLVALKEKDIKAYPEALIDASIAFLKNEKLLNTYVSIVYRKTRLYDSQSVMQVFEVINKWLIAIRENGKIIPTTFDYNFFFKGVYMVLEEDHALNIAKVLSVLYTNFNVFPYDQKQQLCEFLFEKVFFKFFLHWSWNIRQIFHHFLLYRLYHQHRATNTNLENLDDLKKELLLYNQKRKGVQQTKMLLINDFINMEYSRNMTIIENGYRKMKEQKGKRNRNITPQKDPIIKKPLKPKKNLSYALQIPKRGVNNNLLLQAQTKESNILNKDSLPVPQLRESKSEKKEGNQVINPITETSFDKNDSFENSSCWVVSPDKLDITIPEPLDEIGKKARSESMFVESNFMKDGEETKRNKNAGDQKSEQEYNSQDNSRKYESPGPCEEEKKKVIHRRIVYFDRQSQEVKEIPLKYIVYLDVAYSEYESTKVQYLVWLAEKENNLKEMKEDEVEKWNADPKVPELIVQIPADENIPELDQES